jgi:hypothetical protein
MIRFSVHHILAAMSLVLLSGCGAESHQAIFASSYVAATDTRIRVGTIEDAADKALRKDVGQFGIVNELRVRLEEELDRAGLGASAQSTAPHLVLDVRIVDYQPGNAFGRWLMPGAGSTILSVEGKLYDGTREVGTARSLRTISVGGAYSIGQWKEVFRTVAHDIATDLKKQLRPV